MELISNFSERLFIGNILSIFKKPSRISTREWAEENRILTSEVSSRPGKMNCLETPWMLYVMDCLDDSEIHVIVGKKSAQIAWTETINNWIGRTIDLDPRNILIAFPRAASVHKYYKEKLTPYIKNTPALFSKIGSLTKVSHKHIPYPGGFLILANAGTSEDMKSSVVPYVVVEEPDGVKKDVNNQGDGMALLRQRMKSFSDYKLIYAGTPTDKEFSQVDRAYEQSNQMVYMVPCHHCNQFHVLNFDNLRYDIWMERQIDPDFGPYNPDSAYYVCPHCNGTWNNDEKNANVLNAINFHNKGWLATNPKETEIYGFAFNELLSSFNNSSLVNLAKQYLKAKKAYDEGHEGLMKSFINNSKGEAYVALNNGLNVEELRKKRLHYPEMVVPMEGLVLTCGIDVQRGGSSAISRFAIVVRAWGKNGNSWLVHWIELEGNTLDYSDPVWERLSDYVLQDWPHASGHGRSLKIEACAIDAGDNTELVYQWVKDMTQSIDGKPERFYGQFGPALVATKGTNSSGRTANGYDGWEIYNEPSLMEVQNGAHERKTLAEKMGVNLFLVGSYRSHEELHRRINLKGNRDRWYHCETGYPRYEEGLLSVRKTFESSDQRGIWKQIPGRAKEVNDCERLNLFCNYMVGLRNLTLSQWNILEQRLIARGNKNG